MEDKPLLFGFAPVCTLRYNLARAKKLVRNYRCMLLKMDEAGTGPNARGTRILTRHLIDQCP